MTQSKPLFRYRKKYSIKIWHYSWVVAVFDTVQAFLISKHFLEGIAFANIILRFVCELCIFLSWRGLSFEWMRIERCFINATENMSGGMLKSEIADAFARGDIILLRPYGHGCVGVRPSDWGNCVTINKSCISYICTVFYYRICDWWP